MASEADGEEAQKLSWHNFERDMAGLPSARSGHSLTIVGGTAFVFGGLRASASTGGATATTAETTNELHALHLGTGSASPASDGSEERAAVES